MEAIKQAVVQTLEKQGTIAQLKAQLRAQVFVAVDEYETSSSGTGLAAKSAVPARSKLLNDSDGPLVVQLVLDFLDTCNFAFTKQVFEPELGPNAPRAGRQIAASSLGLTASSSDEPLLLSLVKSYKSGARGHGSGDTAAAPAAAAPTYTTSTAAASSAPAPVSAPLSRPPAPAAPLPRLEPLSVKAPLPSLSSSEPKPSTSVPAAAPPAAAPAAAAAATAKPAATGPSAEESAAYSDETFEEEPVEEEEEPTRSTNDDDDDDYAAAMGFKSSSASPANASKQDAPSSTGGTAAAGTASSRGRAPALDADLLAGDRSFGMSNELAGLDAGNSGGLSYSADFPGGMGAGTGAGELRNSQPALSPISESGPKPVSKLEPLRPLGVSKLAPLGPLASLPTLSSSLSSSKDDPLAGKGPKPLSSLGVRKSPAEIEKEKEEMRRLVMMQSGGDSSLSNSLEAPGNRPRPSGPSTNIYDAEMSVSASMDDNGGGWAGGAREERPFFGSKGLSMDLRDTGLSASDRSGDIEHMGVDLAETAEEWR